MSLLGPGKIWRFWLKLGWEILGTEKLLYLCYFRTPKLDTPNRAWRGFRNFCCLLQLIWSHKKSFLLCKSCWVQLCMTGTQPRQCKETPRMMELHIAFFESSSLEIWMQITALLIQARQQADTNKSITDWFSLIWEILPGILQQQCVRQWARQIEN